MDTLDEKPKSGQIAGEFAGVARYNSRYVFVTVAVLLMAAIWIGKSIEVKHVREEALEDNRVLMGEAAKHVLHSHEGHLLLLSKPFAWAIKAELLQGNLKQIRSYMNQMVQKTNIHHIALADKDGKIIVSTDTREEGRSFLTIGKRAYLSNKQTSLENVGNKKLVVSGPVLGPEGRLGTLMISYTIQPVRFVE
ncbi:MAG: PDC sensor domain-containing protein [Daejeonella sp.]|uniref:PDC sensor domain-containing protein n=1 Tax=Daejeonella sp. JGW-45 TaxID=3034148 RepID=UPI0023EBA8AA|nr:PDC sensor domain-containing protein [Daejeonella sp. JGW-45]